MVDSVPISNGNRRRSVLQLLLGAGQMTGAGLAFFLILETGVNRVSVATMVGTSLLTVVSLCVYRRRGV